MLVLILLSIGTLAVATTYELLAFHHQPVALAALFWSLPVSQQIAWLVIGLALISLMLLTLALYFQTLAKRKTADRLEMRLQGMGCVEQLRHQQQEVKRRLGDVIAKRRSIETSISQLQSSQEEMEQSISGIEQNDDSETLERRLQKLSQFIGTTNTRCAEIEHSLPSVLELEEKCEALLRRVSPLGHKQTGINGVLKVLTESRNRLATTIDRLEAEEGVTLADRIQQLNKAGHEIEERVSTVLAQFSEIETIHREITGLFVRLNQGHRLPHGLDAGGRVVSLNG